MIGNRNREIVRAVIDLEDEVIGNAFPIRVLEAHFRHGSCDPEGIITPTDVNGIVAQRCQVGIVSGATIKLIITRPTVQNIIAGISEKNIGS